MLTTASRRQSVAIVYRHIPQYRQEFYERLRRDLDDDDFDLRLVHGQPVGTDAARADSAYLPWATEIRNRSIGVAGRQLVSQPARRPCQKAAVVVVEAATK